MKHSAAFESAFERTLGMEGGYVNDPDDPGGETNWGISRRSYPGEDIKGLTMERAKEIYWRDYWVPLGCARVRGDVAAELFDTAVNMGPRVAITIAQEACNYLGNRLAVDGICGPATIAALSHQVSPDLLKVLNGLQLCRYVEIIRNNPRQAKFARGWLQRIQVMPI